MAAQATFLYSFTCDNLQPGELYGMSAIFNAPGTTHDAQTGFAPIPADENGVYTFMTTASSVTGGGRYAGFVKAWLRDKDHPDVDDPPAKDLSGNDAIVQVKTP